MKVILPLIMAVLLSACAIEPSVVIKPDQVYQGYPCGDHCPAFQKGYDSAQAGQITNQTDCHGANSDETTGCQAYVVEHVRTSPTFSDLTLK